MDKKELFQGFDAAEWQEALSEQADYLKEKYDFDLIGENPIQADALNEMAREAIHFQTHLAQALRDGLYCQDEKVQRCWPSTWPSSMRMGMRSMPRVLPGRCGSWWGTNFIER